MSAEIRVDNGYRGEPTSEAIFPKRGQKSQYAFLRPASDVTGVACEGFEIFQQGCTGFVGDGQPGVADDRQLDMDDRTFGPHSVERPEGICLKSRRYDVVRLHRALASACGP